MATIRTPSGWQKTTKRLRKVRTPEQQIKGLYQDIYGLPFSIHAQEFNIENLFELDKNKNEWRLKPEYQQKYNLTYDNKGILQTISETPQEYRHHYKYAGGKLRKDTKLKYVPREIRYTQTGLLDTEQYRKLYKEFEEKASKKKEYIKHPYTSQQRWWWGEGPLDAQKLKEKRIHDISETRRYTHDNYNLQYKKPYLREHYQYYKTGTPKKTQYWKSFIMSDDIEPGHRETTENVLPYSETDYDTQGRPTRELQYKTYKATDYQKPSGYTRTFKHTKQWEKTHKYQDKPTTTTKQTQKQKETIPGTQYDDYDAPRREIQQQRNIQIAATKTDKDRANQTIQEYVSTQAVKEAIKQEEQKQKEIEETLKKIDKLETREKWRADYLNNPELFWADTKYHPDKDKTITSYARDAQLARLAKISKTKEGRLSLLEEINITDEKGKPLDPDSLKYWIETGNIKPPQIPTHKEQPEIPINPVDKLLIELEKDNTQPLPIREKEQSLKNAFINFWNSFKEHNEPLTQNIIDSKYGGDKRQAIKIRNEIKRNNTNAKFVQLLKDIENRIDHYGARISNWGYNAIKDTPGFVKGMHQLRSQDYNANKYQDPSQYGDGWLDKTRFALLRGTTGSVLSQFADLMEATEKRFLKTTGAQNWQPYIKTYETTLQEKIRYYNRIPEDTYEQKIYKQKKFEEIEKLEKERHEQEIQTQKYIDSLQGKEKEAAILAAEMNDIAKYNPNYTQGDLAKEFFRQAIIMMHNPAFIPGVNALAGTSYLAGKEASTKGKFSKELWHSLRNKPIQTIGPIVAFGTLHGAARTPSNIKGLYQKAQYLKASPFDIKKVWYKPIEADFIKLVNDIKALPKDIKTYPQRLKQDWQKATLELPIIKPTKDYFQTIKKKAESHYEPIIKNIEITPGESALIYKHLVKPETTYDYTPIKLQNGKYIPIPSQKLRGIVSGSYSHLTESGKGGYISIPEKTYIEKNSLESARLNITKEGFNTKLKTTIYDGGNFWVIDNWLFDPALKKYVLNEPILKETLIHEGLHAKQQTRPTTTKDDYLSHQWDTTQSKPFLYKYPLQPTVNTIKLWLQNRLKLKEGTKRLYEQTTGKKWNDLSPIKKLRILQRANKWKQAQTELKKSYKDRPSTHATEREVHIAESHPTQYKPTIKYTTDIAGIDTPLLTLSKQHKSAKHWLKAIKDTPLLQIQKGKLIIPSLTKLQREKVYNDLLPSDLPIKDTKWTLPPDEIQISIFKNNANKRNIVLGGSIASNWYYKTGQRLSRGLPDDIDYYFPSISRTKSLAQTLTQMGKDRDFLQKKWGRDIELETTLATPTSSGNIKYTYTRPDGTQITGKIDYNPSGPMRTKRVSDGNWAYTTRHPHTLRYRKQIGLLSPNLDRNLKIDNYNLQTISELKQWIDSANTIQWQKDVIDFIDILRTKNPKIKIEDILKKDYQKYFNTKYNKYKQEWESRLKPEYGGIIRPEIQIGLKTQPTKWQLEPHRLASQWRGKIPKEIFTEQQLPYTGIGRQKIKPYRTFPENKPTKIPGRYDKEIDQRWQHKPIMDFTLPTIKGEHYRLYKTHIKSPLKPYDKVPEIEVDYMAIKNAENKYKDQTKYQRQKYKQTPKNKEKYTYTQPQKQKYSYSQPNTKYQYTTKKYDKNYIIDQYRQKYLKEKYNYKTTYKNYNQKYKFKYGLYPYQTKYDKPGRPYKYNQDYYNKPPPNLQPKKKKQDTSSKTLMKGRIVQRQADPFYKFTGQKTHSDLLGKLLRERYGNV